MRPIFMTLRPILLLESLDPNMSIKTSTDKSIKILFRLGIDQLIMHFSTRLFTLLLATLSMFLAPPGYSKVLQMHPQIPIRH